VILPGRIARWSLAGLAAAFFASGLAASTGCAAGGAADFGVDASGDVTVDGTVPSDGSGDGSTHLGAHDGAKDAPHSIFDANGSSDGAGADAHADTGPTCLSPQVLCSSSCANIQSDPANCGSCGHACGAGLVCSSGKCTVTCADNQIKCSGSSDVPDGGSKDAAAHEAGAKADGAVFDASAEAGQGGLDAGTNPTVDYCANPDNDRLNCGGCDIVCPYGPHSTPVCGAGKCSITCDTGYSDCDGNPANGCEVNTAGDPTQCGACGNVCNVANAQASCTNGMCGIGSCLPGFADCNMKVADGCEVDTNNPNNCGTCGNVCPTSNDTATCPNGTCLVGQCSAGFQDCDGKVANGCETSTTGDTNNCGACGTKCPAGNDTPSCTNGQCGILTCNPGYTDCDMMAADGCEVDTAGDVNNCGTCGHICSAANGTPSCTNGVCGISTCAAGFTDCDGNPANGCEVETSNDPNHCGTCGTKCSTENDTVACKNGICGILSCNAGYTDCDGLVGDGCETNTGADPLNCGTCNKQCFATNGTPACGNGACTVASCNAPFDDCDGNVANGCETNVSSDDGNCGACGNDCNVDCGAAPEHVTATACSAGACKVTGCTSSYIDFDGKCTDGCECPLSTTQTACTSAESLFTGTFSPGDTATPVTSTMAPASVTAAYFTITFTGTNNINFHPKIVLSGSAEFVMDITGDCNGSKLSSCADNGNADSDGVTTWEESYTGPSPKADPATYPVTGSHFNAIVLGQVWIKVYRKAGAATTCGTYTLTVSE
jgi:hypothetical protein